MRQFLLAYSFVEPQNSKYRTKVPSMLEEDFVDEDCLGDTVYILRSCTLYLWRAAWHLVIPVTINFNCPSLQSGESTTGQTFDARGKDASEECCEGA
jgi:hypothetical protein